MNEISQPITEIKGIGPKFAERLAKLKLKTVKDLLYYFPFRYQDFSKISNISDLEEGQIATIFGNIESIKIMRTWKKKMFIVEAKIDDGTDQIKAVWFNQKFLITMLKEGMSVNLSGKVSAEKKNKKRLYLSSPVYEIISGQSQAETRHTARIVPIYPETKGITSRGIRLVMSKIINFADTVKEFLPKNILSKYKFPQISSAIKNIHFPKTNEDADASMKRFAFQDLFLLQLVKTNEKWKMEKNKAKSFDYNPEDIKKYFSFLPFELTLSQKKVLYEILEDLKRPRQTNRLLQGDVGSGKTIVAAIAAMNVAKSGSQAIFMAPTEILATQHYKTFKETYDEFDGGVALLTSSNHKAFFGQNLETELKKKDLLEKIKNGEIKIVIGTHAVIQKNVAFKDAAFVVIDEQHRFGVRQRAFISQGEEYSPHLLSMSATPIPRTLSLAIFGDLDLSLINEMPKNRKPIITKVVSPQKRNLAYDFIRKEIKNGRQCFVICPRIEPPDQDSQTTQRKIFQLDIKSVKEEFEKLSKKIFPELNVAMLHGRLKAKEKNDIMSKFKNKEIDLLVSTSVIEVGIDVPNATIMMIEGSERFGLAQLYQFRGRVGRGEHQSYCLLFTDTYSKTIYSRLNSIVEAKNGYELAEKDLQLRGPGQFLGEEQAGIPDIAMKALKNPDLVKNAKEEADKILSEDPKLKKYPYLSDYLLNFRRQIHLE